MSLRVIPTRWANYICLFLMLVRGGGSHHFQIFGRKYFAGGTEICLCVDPACQYDSKFTHVHEFAISGKRMGYVAGYRIWKHDHQNAIYHLWERLGDSRFLHQWCFHWLPLFLLQTNKPANKKSLSLSLLRKFFINSSNIFVLITIFSIQLLNWTRSAMITTINFFLLWIQRASHMYG